MLLIVAKGDLQQNIMWYWWTVHILFIFVNRTPEVGLQGKQTWMQGQGRDDRVQGVESPVPPSLGLNECSSYPSITQFHSDKSKDVQG